ncbi:hypothetical protein KDA00_01340 [Candidatus Saccharibacteria bacterium]|nr:hypothetical protein [Candidatus Saccharibacteria bacterium]
MNKQLKDINYSVLFGVKDISSQALKETLGIGSFINPYISGTVVLFLVVGVFFLYPMAGFFLMAFFYARFASILSKKKNNLWSEFAHSNDWPVFHPMATDPRYVPPGIYGVGKDPKMSPVVHAEFEGHECDLFLYEFTTGSGKSRTVHYYTIARVDLVKPFPHLILDSKHCYALSRRGDADQSVKLEGEFPKHFGLYYKKGEHIDALSVITPDVMSDVLEVSMEHDIEIIDNNLFFIIHADKRNAEDIKRVLYSVDKVADEIKHKQKTIRYKPTLNEQERILTQVASKSFGSINNVQNNLSLAIMIVALLPFIFFLLLGVIVSTLGSASL